jgi:hypothetical protein
MRCTLITLAGTKDRAYQFVRNWIVAAAALLLDPLCMTCMSKTAQTKRLYNRHDLLMVCEKRRAQNLIMTHLRYLRGLVIHPDQVN